MTGCRTSSSLFISLFLPHEHWSKHFTPLCSYINNNLPSASQESYPLTPPLWFVDSDDPSLTQILERLEDVRKGNTLVRVRISCRIYKYSTVPRGGFYFQHPNTRVRREGVSPEQRRAQGFAQGPGRGSVAALAAFSTRTINKHLSSHSLSLGAILYLTKTLAVSVKLLARGCRKEAFSSTFPQRPGVACEADWGATDKNIYSSFSLLSSNVLQQPRPQCLKY